MVVPTTGKTLRDGIPQKSCLLNLKETQWGSMSRDTLLWVIVLLLHGLFHKRQLPILCLDKMCQPRPPLVIFFNISKSEMLNYITRNFQMAVN